MGRRGRPRTRMAEWELKERVEKIRAQYNKPGFDEK